MASQRAIAQDLNDSAPSEMLPNESPEKALIRQLKARDHEAITQVVRAYSSHLYRAALGAGFSETEAGEVVQSTMLTFLETLDRFEGRSKVRTWLFGILYKKISEARRKYAKQLKEDDIDEVVESRFAKNGHWSKSPRDPGQKLEASQTMETIQTCISELPEAHKSAFYLREVEGFSTDEICKILSITATNLGVILYRARNRLRECVERHGIERRGKNA